MTCHNVINAPKFPSGTWERQSFIWELRGYLAPFPLCDFLYPTILAPSANDLGQGVVGKGVSLEGLEFIHAELLREMGEHIGILVVLHKVHGLTSIDESVTEHFALFLQDILGHHPGEGKAGNYKELTPRSRLQGKHLRNPPNLRENNATPFGATSRARGKNENIRGMEKRKCVIPT